MFTAALFTGARRWKQPKCLSVDEEIKQNVVYTSSGSLSLKKKGYSDICYNMDAGQPWDPVLGEVGISKAFSVKS